MHIFGWALLFDTIFVTEFNKNVYYFTPPNFQIKYGGCGTSFGVSQGLSCIKGGLVIASHNEVRKKIIYLAWRSFPSYYVRVEPLVYQGCSKSEGGGKSGGWYIVYKGWRTHPGLMGQKYWRHNWRQTWRHWRGYLQVLFNGKSPG